MEGRLLLQPVFKSQPLSVAHGLERLGATLDKYGERSAAWSIRFKIRSIHIALRPCTSSKNGVGEMVISQAYKIDPAMILGE